MRSLKKNISILLTLALLTIGAAIEWAKDKSPNQKEKQGERVTASQRAEQSAFRVVAITDGDTIKVLNPQKEEIKVRLLGIDAPEKGTPYGAKAKETLSSLVFNKTVSLAGTKKDRYGRTLATVYLPDGTSVNLKMVELGMAWAYTQYSKDPAILAAQKTAQSKRMGLWNENAPTPPWETRKKK